MLYKVKIKAKQISYTKGEYYGKLGINDVTCGKTIYIKYKVLKF